MFSFDLKQISIICELQQERQILKPIKGQVIVLINPF